MTLQIFCVMFVLGFYQNTNNYQELEKQEPVFPSTDIGVRDGLVKLVKYYKTSDVPGRNLQLGDCVKVNVAAAHKCTTSLRLFYK